VYFVLPTKKVVGVFVRFSCAAQRDRQYRPRLFYTNQWVVAPTPPPGAGGFAPVTSTRRTLAMLKVLGLKLPGRRFRICQVLQV
jgi:hypothetical protein